MSDGSDSRGVSASSGTYWEARETCLQDPDLHQDPGLSDWPDCSPPGEADIRVVTGSCMSLDTFLETPQSSATMSLRREVRDASPAAVADGPDAVSEATAAASMAAATADIWREHTVPRHVLAKFWKVMGEREGSHGLNNLLMIDIETRLFPWLLVMERL